MRYRVPALIVALAPAVAFIWFSAIVGAQGAATLANTTAATTIAKDWTPPRTAWGDPDLQGIWSTDDSIGVPIQRPDQYGNRLYLTDEEIADRARRDAQIRQRSLEETAAPAPAPGGPADTGPPSHWGEQGTRTARQTSLIVDPPDGKIPALTPEAQRRAASRDTGSFGGGPFNGPEDLTNYDRCITRSVVGSLIARPYGNGLQIVQTPGFVAIRHEMIHDTRVIPVDERPHLGAGIRQYMGDSRGRWDGETLVVETTNLTDKTSIGLNGNGLRHSEAMRLVERFTRVNADTIQYEVTIDDPKTYVRPWKMTFPFTTQPGSYQVFEYACHEGNYGMTNILSAARTAERLKP
jgi:hypothetical protein